MARQLGLTKPWMAAVVLVGILLPVMAIWLFGGASSNDAPDSDLDSVPGALSGAGPVYPEEQLSQGGLTAPSIELRRDEWVELPDDNARRESQTLLAAARATSATHWQRLAQQALEHGDIDLARKLELVEDTTCGPLLRDDLAPELERETQAFRQWSVLCADAGIDLASDGAAERSEYLAWLDERQELAENQFLELSNSMSAEAAFLSLLEGAQSPFEVNVLSLAFGRRMEINLPGYLLPNIGPFDPEALFELNDLLLRFYSCEKFRHCEPEHWITIESCLFGHCQEGRGYLDLLRWHSSPRDVALVEAMLEEIERRRLRGWTP